MFYQGGCLSKIQGIPHYNFPFLSQVMSDFFEQKEKSLIHFRDNINKFIKGMLFVVLEAKTLKLKDQITIDVMT